MIKKILIFIIIIGVILYFARNQIVKEVLEFGAKRSLNLNIKIKDLKLSLLKSSILLKDVYILNPKNYPEKEMIYISKIFLAIKPISLIRGEVHIKNLILNIIKINVIKNKENELNIASLQKSKKEHSAILKKKQIQKKKGKIHRKIKIDNLRLKIGKLTYKDYSSKPYQIRQFYLNIDKQYHDIEDFNKFKNTLLTELGLEYLKKNLNIEVIKGIGDKTNINQSIKDLLEGAKDKLKGLLEKVK
jgi:uncharacterized protein involved in outer membrane biogenesis